MARSPDVMNTRGQIDRAPKLSSTQGRSQRDVIGYQKPFGPSNINDPKGPGLHGDNCGNCGSQGYYEDERKQSSGSPGIGGDRPSMGTNRKG